MGFLEGFLERGLLEKGSFDSFQKSPFSRNFSDLRDSRDCGKQRRIRPSSRDSLENWEILEILEIPPVKRPLSYNDPFFRSRSWKGSCVIEGAETLRRCLPRRCLPSGPKSLHALLNSFGTN